MKKTLAIIFVLLAVGQVSATNYYVSPTGDDDADGLTPETAWISIDNGDQKGLLLQGDTVLILPGVYRPASSIQFKTHGSADQPIVYRKSGKGEVIVDGGGASNIILIGEGHHTRISDLILTNGADHGLQIKGDSCEVSHCFVYGVGKDGIRVEGADALLLRNVVANVKEHGVNIRDAGPNCNVYGQTIYGCGKNGVEIQPKTARIYNSIVILNDKGIHGDAGNVCAFNDVWNNVSANYDGGVTDFLGGISVDPLLADPSLGNFSLMAGSPAIDAGYDLGYCFSQAAPEMGAIEKYNVYYVSPAGDDNNSGCRSDSAWYSIDNGDGRLYPGDTVYVAAGVYADSITISDSGVEGDGIVYKGVRDSCLIDGEGYTSVVHLAADYILWQAIDVVHAKSSGLLVQGNQNIIEECKFYDSDKAGINVVSGVGNKIRRVVFDNNAVAGLVTAGDVTEVSNCTFYNPGVMALDAVGSVDNEITNCLFIGVGSANVAVRATAETKLSYCDIFNHNTPVQGGVVPGEGMLDVDPLLIDPGMREYRLSALSPAIDAGIDVGLPYTSPAPDMGAYETGLPVSLTITPTYDSLIADSSYLFAVTAVDSAGYPAGPGELSWSHTFVTAEIDSTGLLTPNLVETGAVVVTSSIAGLADTTDLMTVVPGSLDSLHISPESDTISADSTRQFIATGYDSKGNETTELGELSWVVERNIGDIDNGGLFDAVTAGAGFIRVFSHLGPEATTDTIVVVPGSVAAIKVIPSENTVEELTAYQYHAYSYDADSNLVDTITSVADWSTTDPSGNVDATGLYTAGNVPSPPDYFVKAVYEGSFSDSSEVTVATSGALSYVVIEVASGAAVGDTTLSTDNDSTRFFCRGYDSGDNLIGNTSVTWSLIGETEIGTLTEGPDARTDLMVTTPGTGRVVATHASGLADTTGLIIVHAGFPVSVVASPDTATISADSTLRFSVTSYDADGNPSSPSIIPGWEVLGGIGTIDSSGIFDAVTAGEGRIVVTGGGLADTTEVITVVPGAMAQLEIVPNNAVLGVGDSLQFTAEGRDEDSNLTETGDLVWQVLGRIGTIDGDGLYVADLPGICSVLVTSSIGGMMDISGAVTVEALYLSAIPTENPVVYPGQTQASLLAFRIDNFHSTEQSITSVTVREGSRGSGSPDELLANIDFVSLYCDMDNDSVLTVDDSLVTSAAAEGAVTPLSFDPVGIQAGGGRTFFIGADISLYPHDGDTLDAFLLSSTDILTGDLTTIDGPDTANSPGVSILDGMVHDQVGLISTGLVTINPADSLYNLMIVDVPRNGYEADLMQTFSVENLGSATAADIGTLYIFRDDGNGEWGGTGEETALGNLVFTGSLWIRSGLTEPLLDVTTRFYAAARISDYPVDGSTIALTIPPNGLEMLSHNDGPIDVHPQPIDTITIETFETVDVSSIPLPSRTLVPGDYSGPLCGIDIVNGYALPVGLDSLRLTLYADDPAGATIDQLVSQVDSLLVYLNGDGNHGAITSGDSLLIRTGLDRDNLVIATPGLSLSGSGGGVGLTAVVFLNAGNTRDGNSINLGLASEADLYLDGAVTFEASFPVINESDHFIDAFTTAAVTFDDLETTTIYGAQTSQPVLDFTLPDNGYAADNLRSLRLVNRGSLTTEHAFEDVRLLADVSGDGLTGDDVALGSFVRIGEGWTLSGISYPMVGDANRFLVVVDVVGEQFTGGTLQWEIPVGGAIYWSGMTGPDNAGAFGSQSLLVFPANRVTAISIPTSSQTVLPGSSQNAILTFALYNGYVEQTQTLQGVNLVNQTHTGSDSSFADYELGQVSAFFDADQDRTLGDDSLIAAGYFANSRLSLTGFDVDLPPESLSYFFVVVDVPLNGIDSDSLAVAIASPADFIFENSVILNGDLPLTNGGHLIVDGSVVDQYRTLPLDARTLSPGDSDVVVLAFQPAINGDQLDVLQSVSIENQGDADNSDIASLELWLDVNGDSSWQAGDSLLGTMAYTGGTWSLAGLAVDVSAGSVPNLLAVADISMAATPGVIFQGAVAVLGCQYLSANDGPIDNPLVGTGVFSVSDAGLRVSSATFSQAYSLGQTIAVELTVTNVSDSSMVGVLGQIMSISDSNLVVMDSAVAGPADLAAGEAIDFVYYYRGLIAGEVSWQLRAATQGGSDSSAVIQAGPVQLQEPPSSAVVQLVSSIPTAVTKGQTNVFPLILNCTHPVERTASASLRLDSLRINVEDGAGGLLAADEVFSRMLLANGYTVLTFVDVVPSSSSVLLAFDNPVMIAPSETESFTLRVDIDSAATAADFALSVADAGAVILVDENTLLPVPIDPSVTFPLTTASCRVDEPSIEGAVSSVSLLGESVNFGQEDVDILQLNLQHPGQAGSSQIQLTQVSFEFVDYVGDPFAPANLVSEVKLLRQQIVVGQVGGAGLNQSPVTMALTSPLTLNAGEADSLRLVATINEESGQNGFRLVVPDSVSIVIRDLGSGFLLTTVTDTTVISSGSAFPMFSGWAELKQPAELLETCAGSTLPSSIVGGVDSLALLQYHLTYPVGTFHSSVLVRDARFTVLDSAGTPMDPNQLFDRVGYRLNSGPVNYQSFIQLFGGATVVEIGPTGVVVNPGDTILLELVADIEADVPYDHFVLQSTIDNALMLCDATDTASNPGFDAGSDCGSSFPFVTGRTEIYLAAGRPSLAARILPGQMVFPGQNDLTAFEADLTYSSDGLQGDLEISCIRGVVYRRTGQGLQPFPGSQVFRAVHCLIDGNPVGSDSLLSGDSVTVWFDSPQVVANPSEQVWRIMCDIAEDAPLGNYVLRFQDSLMLDIFDRNLLNPVYPIIGESGYPVAGAELSVTPAGLGNSFVNYPNPFNPSTGEVTRIGFVLDEAAHIDIELFSITGKAVSLMVDNDFRPAGSHQDDVWAGFNDNGQMVIPGTYFCRITARYVSGREESYRRKIAVIR